MKLYAVEAVGVVSGGVAIVVAENQAEARAVAATLGVVDHLWRVDYRTPVRVGLLTESMLGDTARVLYHHETGQEDFGD